MINLIPLPNKQTVKDFLSAFGTVKELIDALDSMGIHVTRNAIKQWREGDMMPDFIYQALVPLVKNLKQLAEARGSYVEVYYKNKPIGQFHLALGVEVVVKKR